MTAPRTLDELVVALSALRSEAGTPSYAEIARRIGEAGGAEPAKVTVYDCFRSGRRRIDAGLVHDIVRALGQDSVTAARWRVTAAELSGERNAAHVQAVFAPRGDAGDRIGREDLLARMPDADVIVLSGLPGVGKSTIASALAAGQKTLTVELRESEVERPVAGPVDVARRMLGALGLRSVPYDLARLRERLADQVAGRTVILEDAASAERLAALVVPGARHVVTSRVELDALDDHPALRGMRIVHIAVRPMDHASSLRLLRHLLTEAGGTAAPDRRSPEPDDEAMARIVAVSGGLPLDIAMLAGVVRELPGWTFDDLASRFESESRDVRMRPVLEAATRAVSTADGEVLADAALLDRSIDLGLLRAVHPDADAAVARLRARHLLDVQDGEVRMHATVFDFVRDRSVALRPESKRRRIVQGFADALLARMEDDPDSAARDITAVLAVAEAARAHGLDTVCERIAVMTRPVLTQWTLWGESLRLHDLAASGRDLTETPDLALGIAHSAEKLGRFDEALVILHRVRRVASGAALARTWNQIGNVQRWMSHFDEALAAYSTAIDVAREERDRVIEGRATGNHADTLRIIARYAEAESGYTAALAIAESVEDDINIGIVRSNRCLLLISTGTFDEAETELQDLLTASGDRAVPHLRMTKALLCEARGDDPAAAAVLVSAVATAVGADEYGPSADMVLLRARLDARAGQAEQAIAAARGAWDHANRSGSPLVATEAANTLAEILLGTGNLTDATACAEEAIGIAEATGDRAEVARGWSVLAAIASARGDGDRARDLGEVSRSLYRDIGHRLGRARIA
ncbi:MAG: tetratricopeptide repeat protein [Microbacterium sp.]|jgi:tetratricopeptide (TPR) repeat protein|nr:tetratricopeptide repeat protein [Microbacterium sp.]